MRLEEFDTIAAIATASGPAGVSIVRISGPEAWSVAAGVAPDDGWGRRRAGTFFHTRFVNPEGGDSLDDGLVLLFRAPSSFTGEDVVELQGHGGDAAAQALLRAALSAGARLAAPGEFTRRAFLNGRIDLTQAEAVMDLVHARTARAMQVAQAQLDGGLGQRVAACYERLSTLQAEVEARLDFDADELPQRILGDEVACANEARLEVQSLLSTWRSGKLLRQGALVAISGCPNAGKSSLMNALLGKDRAIVSSIAGTTRDTIEDWFQIDGLPLRLIDTAGLRQTACQIEMEGVRRAGRVLGEADLILYLIDRTRPLSEQHPRLFMQAFAVDDPRVIVIMNKCDLPAAVSPRDLAATFPKLRGEALLTLSAKEGVGLDLLRTTMLDRLGFDRQAPQGGQVSERHRQELLACDHALEGLLCRLQENDESLVLAAEELRAACAALGRIIGRECSDELLDRVFSAFCLGK